MTNKDISGEVVFKTARSGGKGGQNVNKVETMVEGRWDIGASALCSETEKQLLLSKLASRITKGGALLVKSQTARTQLANKALVVQKMNELVNRALARKKIRLATRPTRASRQKRLEHKTLHGQKKKLRGRVKRDG